MRRLKGSKYRMLLTEVLLTEERVVTPERPFGNAVVLMGAPGSGKSMVSKFGLINLEGIKHMSSDTWTEMLAKRHGEDVGDSSVTAKYHGLYSGKFKKHSSEAMRLNRTGNFLVEITGKSEASLLKRVSQLSSFGFRVILVHVRVPIGVAIMGNRSRERMVPESILETAHLNAIKNFDAAVSHADEAWIINNWTGSRYPTYDDFRSSNFVHRIK